MAAESPVRRPGTRALRAAPTALRRRPKTLHVPPTVFHPGSGGAGLVPASRRRPGPTVPAARRAVPGGATDERGELVVAPVLLVRDLQAQAEARQIMARLALPRPRRQRRSRQQAGELVSAKYRGGEGDIDVDRTLEVLLQRSDLTDEDIVVRQRRRQKRSVVLLVDVSGSMRGERVRTAAATVGALSGHLAKDDVAVVAFWSDAALLQPFGEQRPPMALLDLLLRLPAEGLTNVGFPLEVAAGELRRIGAQLPRVLLLSDCVHNAGPDPRLLARRLPRLDVLLDVSGQHDEQLGRELAAGGRGQLRRVRHHRDVAAALERLFEDG